MSDSKRPSRRVHQDMNDSQGREALQASADWLEAAANVGLQLLLARPQSDRALWPAHYNLLMISRAQYASELSYRRFHAYAFNENLSESTASHLERIEEILRGYLEAHSFLVSAHLYWRSLRAVNDYLLGPAELNQAIVASEDLISQTATARHHAEHFIERIERGRTRGYGQGRPEMTAEVFREAMGRIEGTTVIYGDERFDLSVIHETIRVIGKEVAPRVKAAIPLPTTRIIQTPVSDVEEEPPDEGR
jgi:hypothetical protein